MCKVSMWSVGCPGIRDAPHHTESGLVKAAKLSRASALQGGHLLADGFMDIGDADGGIDDVGEGFVFEA